MTTCFKYEFDYHGGCWDFLEWGMGENCPKCGAEIHGTDSIPRLLNKFYGVEITDTNEFMNRLFRCFEGMHEAGIIKPE